MDGISVGIQLGREKERERWTENGHLDNGTCTSRTAGDAVTSTIEETPSPAPTTADDSANIMSVLTGFDWADDADSSLPLHTTRPTPPPPRDLSALRSAPGNAFSTLKRRHSRHHGSRASAGRRRQFYCAPPKQFTSLTSTLHFDGSSTKTWGGVLAWASLGWLAQATGGIALGVFGSR
ncbi:hypothetical protein R3P38DRAFT_2911969 [Favolaschia claudopus]|uniref:Uncharacterized protein n=1 Tax=Favolaschia claudopus TaxID=2862362 RepID=A0AAW0C8C3_9AGAR